MLLQTCRLADFIHSIGSRGRSSKVCTRRRIADLQTLPPSADWVSTLWGKTAGSGHYPLELASLGPAWSLASVWLGANSFLYGTPIPPTLCCNCFACCVKVSPLVFANCSCGLTP